MQRGEEEEISKSSEFPELMMSSKTRTRSNAHPENTRKTVNLLSKGSLFSSTLRHRQRSGYCQNVRKNVSAFSFLERDPRTNALALNTETRKAKSDFAMGNQISTGLRADSELGNTNSSNQKDNTEGYKVVPSRRNGDNEAFIPGFEVPSDQIQYYSPALESAIRTVEENKRRRRQDAAFGPPSLIFRENQSAATGTFGRKLRETEEAGFRSAPAASSQQRILLATKFRNYRFPRQVDFIPSGRFRVADLETEWTMISPLPQVYYMVEHGGKPNEGRAHPPAGRSLCRIPTPVTDGLRREGTSVERRRDVIRDIRQATVTHAL